MAGIEHSGGIELARHLGVFRESAVFTVVRAWLATCLTQGDALP